MWSNLPDKAPRIGAFRNCKNENKDPTSPPNKTDVTGSFSGIDSQPRKPSTPFNIDLYKVS